MKIVDLHGHKPVNDPAIVYCGRATRNGWKASPLGNPFRGDGWQAKYTDWLGKLIGGEFGQERAAEAIRFLAEISEHSTLGCWCINIDAKDIAPAGEERCHTEVIAKVWRHFKGSVPH